MRMIKVSRNPSVYLKESRQFRKITKTQIIMLSRNPLSGIFLVPSKLIAIPLSTIKMDK